MAAYVHPCICMSGQKITFRLGEVIKGFNNGKINLSDSYSFVYQIYFVFISSSVNLLVNCINDIFRIRSGEINKKNNETYNMY